MKPQLQLTAKHVLTQMLHRSLEILQLPQLELAALILEEVEKNPLLELASNVLFEPIACAQVPKKESFQELLYAQVREALPGKEMIGEKLILELDERGFLPMSPRELSLSLKISLTEVEKILQIVKTFDPPGVFAQNLQEAFALQLERQGEVQTLAYQIVKTAFADFLAGKYAYLKKKFRANSLQFQEAVDKIGCLNPRVSDVNVLEPLATIYPDLKVEEVEGIWTVSVLDEAVPKLRLNPKYRELKGPVMRGFLATAKWLFRSIERRKNLLLAIGKYLVKKQGLFFETSAPPLRISAETLANEFGVHESTIFRAIAGKYIESSQGLIPMRLLVSSPANGSVKEMLRRLIEEEQDLPYTDEDLVRELAKGGHKVARRTVAKYRKELRLGTASVRKHFRK